MDLGLTEDGMGEHTASTRVDGYAGLVTGGFDTQNAHGAVNHLGWGNTMFR
jgi:hypothetical protein